MVRASLVAVLSAMLFVVVPQVATAKVRSYAVSDVRDLVDR